MRRVRLAPTGVRLAKGFFACCVLQVLSPGCLRRDPEVIPCQSDAECVSFGKVCDAQQRLCVASVGSPASGGSSSNGQGGGQFTSGGSASGGSPTGGSTTSGGSTSGGGSDSPGTTGGQSAGSGAGGEATASGGASSAGASGTGGGGAGGASSTGGAAGTSTYEMIDDLEDNDGRIPMTGGRTGPWHIFNSLDGGGNQQPAKASPFVPEIGGAAGTMRAVHTSGDGYTYAGVGFDLNNADAIAESSKSQAYDASAWQGIAFWAKGTGQVRVELPTRGFVPADRGGNCSSDCWNVYGHRLPNPLTPSWQEYRVSFAVLEREMGGRNPVFTANEVMSISFKHEGNNDRFDFWIDEVRFYR